MPPKTPAAAIAALADRGIHRGGRAGGGGGDRPALPLALRARSIGGDSARLSSGRQPARPAGRTPETCTGSVRAGAELYTYLRHPWPRTQLFSALLRPLPEEITFLQVQIFRQPAAGGKAGNILPNAGQAGNLPRDTKAEEEKLKLLPAAGRDLTATPGPAGSAANGCRTGWHGHGESAPAQLSRRLGRHGHLRQGGVGLFQQRGQQQGERARPVPRRAGRSAGLRPAGRPPGTTEEGPGTKIERSAFSGQKAES